MSSVESALRRAALLFRLLAVAWMAVMVAISLLTDDEVRVPVVLGAFALAVLGAAWSSRHLLSARPLSTAFLLQDSLLALVVAVSPELAGANDAFYGGYPMSAVVMLAFSRHVGWGLGAAGVFSLARLAALVAGAPSAPTPAEWVSFVVMTTVVALVVGVGAEFLRTAERRRADAEEALEEERRRHAVEQARMAERLTIADDLHDSLLQTVRVLGQSAADPERVRALARRQERDLRSLIERMQGGGKPGVAAAVRAEAADVEDLYGVVVEVVASGDAEVDDAVAELVRAVREAMVNAARHSRADRVDVTVEATAGSLLVVVRDRGVGFDPESVEAGHGMASVNERMERLGGRMTLRTARGGGTEVELALPRSGP